jgi:hypothetical protein
MRATIAVATLLCVLYSRAIDAQSAMRARDDASSKHARSDTSEAAESVPPLAAGVTGGYFRFDASHSEQALSAVLQWQPIAWLTLTAAPAWARLQQDSLIGSAIQSRSVSGVTDVPLSAGVTHSFTDVSWSPSFSVGMSATLATGDSAQGLGVGQTLWGATLGVGLSPVDRVSMFLMVGRGLNGVKRDSLVGGTRVRYEEDPASYLDVETSYSLSKRVTANVSGSADLGNVSPGDARYSSLAGGLAVQLAGPLTLTMDGSRGLSTYSGTWSFSVGVGTAFAGLNPVGAASQLFRLRGGSDRGGASPTTRSSNGRGLGKGRGKKA